MVSRRPVEVRPQWKRLGDISRRDSIVHRREREDHEGACGMRYYDLIANWPKIEPLLSHPKVQETINDNYNRYSLGMLGVSFIGMTIEQLYELRKRTEFGDDWKQEGWDARHGDRQPYWVIACPNSCH